MEVAKAHCKETIDCCNLEILPPSVWQWKKEKENCFICGKRTSDEFFLLLPMAGMISNRSPSENFVLIYLHENLPDDLQIFQSLINTIQCLSDADEFRRLIEDIIDERLFVILSDHFGEQLIRELQTKSQIDSIYVYSHRKESRENWTNNFSKVKGVYTDLLTISNAFRRDIRQATVDLISIHILPPHNPNPSFLYSLLSKQILLNIPSTDQTKNDLIEYSYFQYQENPVQSILIDQFENTDYKQISPIEWYTRECFLSSMIHRALRLYDIEILNRIGFFIRDLNHQIQDLHAKSTDSKHLSVYYGQGISNQQLETFRMNINGLMTFNSFLLTTIDKELSRQFAKQSKNDISILYRIEIDRSTTSTAFTLLDQFDYYHDTDQYVLFALDAIFRIHHLERLEENFWQMNCLLIDPNEPSLKDLIKPKQISRGFLSLGQMMFQTNDFNPAKNILQALILSTDRMNPKHLASVYRMLGRIDQKNGDFTSALLHYQECMKTESTYLSPNDPSLALTLAGIGAILEKLGDLNQALEYYRRAAGCEKAGPSNLAFYHLSIGRILRKQGENIEARMHFELALKFGEKSSVSNAKILADIHRLLTKIS